MHTFVDSLKMGSHVRFETYGDNEQKETCSDPIRMSVTKELPTIKTVQKKPQKYPASGSKKKSKSKLPANQIRNIERYLKHNENKLPPGLLKKKKQELEEWKRVRAERERRARERKFESRYKRIKFFENRKLQRVLQNIAEGGDKPEDQEAKHQAQRDLQYIQHYPKDRKYIALFPSGGHTDESRKKVEQMRAIISRSDVTPETQPTSNTNALGDDFFLDDDNVSD
ncbi:unnamed protein product [Agarophyton chilense]